MSEFHFFFFWIVFSSFPLHAIFFIFTYYSHSKQLHYNSVWAHSFVYWKASVFLMTAITEQTKKSGRRRRRRVKNASTQMNCSLHKITIFIQFPLVQYPLNKIWPHSVIEYAEKKTFIPFFSFFKTENLWVQTQVIS